jgi:hypothetical protein
MCEEHPDLVAGRALFDALPNDTKKRHLGEYVYFNIHTGECEIGPESLELMDKLRRRGKTAGITIVGFRIPGEQQLSVTDNKWFKGLRQANKANTEKLIAAGAASNT